MRPHTQGVNSRIGAARCMDAHILLRDRQYGLLYHLLNAGAVILPLPSHERAAIIFEGQSETGHKFCQLAFKSVSPELVEGCSPAKGRGSTGSPLSDRLLTD